MSDERAKLFATGADSTLALLAYAALAIVLMVLDRRSGYSNDLRATAQALARPVWALAELPARMLSSTQLYLEDRNLLDSRVKSLESALLVQNSQIFALRAQAEQTRAVRELLGSDDITAVRGQVARILSLDLNRFSQRIAINRGAAHGVIINAPLIDAQGLVGQVTELGSSSAVAILLTDINHRVPGEIVRNGLRVYVVGAGAGIATDQALTLDRMALSTDIKLGDKVQTSGMGGVFPAGLPIGEVTHIERTPGASFVLAQLRPAAKMALNKVVLVLAPAPAIGPLPPVHPAPINTTPITSTPITSTSANPARTASRQVQ
jgi:rod shape-determining protein MreC